MFQRTGTLLTQILPDIREKVRQYIEPVEPVLTPVACAGVMSTWNLTLRENIDVLLDRLYSALNVDVDTTL